MGHNFLAGAVAGPEVHVRNEGTISLTQCVGGVLCFLQGGRIYQTHPTDQHPPRPCPTVAGAVWGCESTFFSGQTCPVCPHTSTRGRNRPWERPRGTAQRKGAFPRRSPRTGTERTRAVSQLAHPILLTLEFQSELNPL